MKKLLFYLVEMASYPGSGRESSWVTCAELVETTSNPYNKYLCTWLHMGTDSLSVQNYSKFLHELGQLERGEIDQITDSSDRLQAIFTRNGVQFEYDWDDSNPPEGRFALNEVKAAVEGWLQFLKMPKSTHSKLEIALPAPIYSAKIHNE
jgi:hypothetical protein